MSIEKKKEPIFLVVGDLVIFLASLWLALFVRYQEIPSGRAFLQHMAPFAILIVAWIVVFFIAGLYEKHTVFLKSRLPAIILNAQIANSAIALAFFYLIPYFTIAPKLNLFIYLAVSFVLILLWRLYGFAVTGTRKKYRAILIGSGDEMRELKDEVNTNARYDVSFISSIDLAGLGSLDFQKEIVHRVYSEDVSMIAVDLRDERVEPILPHLYNLIFSNVRFIDMHRIYEDIFDRIPLSLVKYSWFMENISLGPNFTYDILKRAMDIILSFSLGLLSLIVYPFIIVAIKLDDGGSIFSVQERVGRNNSPIKLYKFRTMTNANDGGNWGKQDNQITRAGNFLRMSRLDELPQLWNVLQGDISLIGPRPEFPGPVKQYESQVSYYNVRHLIKPGLSGWAQIHHDNAPHHGLDVRETKTKLSYDLYYIKNRSLLLDLKIALQTIKAILSRTGV